MKELLGFTSGILLGMIGVWYLEDMEAALFSGTGAFGALIILRLLR